MYTMSLVCPDGDVKTNLGTQGPQNLYQKGRRCLPIHIKVTPNKNLFMGVYGCQEAFNRRLHPGKQRGWGGGIQGWIEKRFSSLLGCYPPSHQGC